MSVCGQKIESDRSLGFKNILFSLQGFYLVLFPLLLGEEDISTALFLKRFHFMVSFDSLQG